MRYISRVRKEREREDGEKEEMDAKRRERSDRLIATLVT